MALFPGQPGQAGIRKA